MLYGREALLPIDVALGNNPNHSVLNNSFPLLQRFPYLREQIKRKLLMVQQRQKQRYDCRRKKNSYNDGDLVWVYRPLRNKGRSIKLLRKYHGPFQVKQKLTNLTYALILVHVRKRLVVTVHVCNLKPIHPRPSIPTPDISLFPGPLASVSRDSTEDMSPLGTSEHDSVPSKPTSQLPLLSLPTPELVAVQRVCDVGTDKPISTLVRRPRSRLIYDNLRPRKGLAIADRLGMKK
jgi:hypothetical protein